MKTKKLALGFGAVAAIGMPIAGVISCGADGDVGRYDAKDDKLLKMVVDYKKDGVQFKALKKQVDAYNALDTKIRKGYSVELISNYPLSSFLATTYQAQDKNKIPNMVIAYPDTLGLITKYDMQLNLNDASGKSTTTKIDLAQTFSADYISTNDRIGGLPAGGSYLVPITKSTEMIAINKIVLGYLLKQGELKASTGTTTKIDEYIGAYDDAVKDSQEATPDATSPKQIVDIKSNYALKNASKKAAAKFDDAIFTDLEKLLDFLGEVGDIFDLSNKGTKKSYVLGIDSATNLVYNALNAINNGNADDFAFVKDADGYIKYQWKKAQVKANFTRIWNKLKIAIDNGTLFIGGTVNGNKEYGSTNLKKNEMAFSIGSTAGFKYLSEKIDVAKPETKDKLNPSELGVLKPYNQFGTLASGAKGSTLVQGPSLIPTHVNSTENEATAKFIKWFIGDGTATSPLGIFTKEANYIAPTKGLLGGSAPADYDEAMKIAFSQLKAVNDKTIHGFDNPVDDTTGAMRNRLEKAIHLQYSQKKTLNKSSFTIDELYGNLGETFEEGQFN